MEDLKSRKQMTIEEFRVMYPRLEPSFFGMENQDLVVWALTNGFSGQIRGMNRYEIFDLIDESRKPQPVQVANAPVVVNSLPPRVYNPTKKKTIEELEAELAELKRQEGSYVEPNRQHSMGVSLAAQVHPDVTPDGVIGEMTPPALSWNDLQKLAKNKGVKVFGKKRPQIEAELKEL